MGSSFKRLLCAWVRGTSHYQQAGMSSVLLFFLQYCYVHSVCGLRAQQSVQGDFLCVTDSFMLGLELLMPSDIIGVKIRIGHNYMTRASEQHHRYLLFLVFELFAESHDPPPADNPCGATEKVESDPCL
jgi:hypothetical protein